MRKLIKRALGASTLALASMQASAVTYSVDTTDAVAQVGILAGGVSDVGLALVGAAGLAATVRWVKATFF